MTWAPHLIGTVLAQIKSVVHGSWVMRTQIGEALDNCLAHLMQCGIKNYPVRDIFSLAIVWNFKPYDHSWDWEVQCWFPSCSFGLVSGHSKIFGKTYMLSHSFSRALVWPKVKCRNCEDVRRNVIFTVHCWDSMTLHWANLRCSYFLKKMAWRTGTSIV